MNNSVPMCPITVDVRDLLLFVSLIVCPFSRLLNVPTLESLMCCRSLKSFVFVNVKCMQPFPNSV